MKIKTRVYCTDKQLKEMGVDGEGQYVDAVLNLEHVTLAWVSPEDEECTQIEAISGEIYTVDTPFSTIEKYMLQ